MNPQTPMTLEQKRARARALLQQAQASESAQPYTRKSYDMFMSSSSAAPVEAEHFDRWIHSVKADDAYSFEAPRQGIQGPKIQVRRGEQLLSCVNFSSYNYLGYAHHPEVIAAAKDALDTYGLGAASSPIAGGTFELHTQLEAELLDFFDLPDRGIALFSSGYAVNTGTVSAFLKEGHVCVLDRSAHMSLLEGAQLSRAQLRYFRHNDPADLERVLASIEGDTRVLVCVEGVYSAEGDFGRLKELVAVAKAHGAFILVDEAHSMLVAGERGRGVCEAQGVLDDVDMIVFTFSKAFGGIGGGVLARRNIAQYIRWYARCRMFSCALDPAVTGGVLRALQLARTPEGAQRRAQLIRNADYLRGLLRDQLHLGPSESWIVPVVYGADRLTIPLQDHLQREGFEGSLMQFPAVAKGETRIRLFVTSEHDNTQIERAAAMLIRAARQFGFLGGRAR